MSRMPYVRNWQQHLSETFGENIAASLIASAQRHYTDLRHRYPQEEYPHNQKELKARIMPGLAIYQTLLDKLDDPAAALAQTEELFRAAFFPTRISGIRLLNMLPDPFPIIRPALKMMTKNKYLPGSQEIVEDSPDCFALNVYRCFILDVLATHQAQELTPLFCKTDDWLSEALPKISWERTQTLGRGGELCDFRWSRRKG